MLESRKLAQSISMVKSGNMRNNSIKTYITQKGFVVYQDFKVADYGLLLNERDYTARSGLLAGQTTRGWWTEKVYGAILQMLKSTYTSNSTSTKQITSKIVSKPQMNKTFIKSIPKG